MSKLLAAAGVDVADSKRRVEVSEITQEQAAEIAAKTVAAAMDGDEE